MKPELETLAGQDFEIVNFQHISRGKNANGEEAVRPYPPALSLSRERGQLWGIYPAEPPWTER